MSGGRKRREDQRPARRVRLDPRHLLRLRSGERGVALLLVLWLLALLSVMAMSFSGTARTQAHIARNLNDNAQARWLADAGVRLTIHRLWLAQAAAAAQTQTQPPIESRRSCRFGPGSLTVSMQNVTGLIDLNIASPDTLARLFATAGLEEMEAVRLAAAVADFRDTNDRRREDGAEAEDYAAAGLPHGPKNGEFRAVEELEQVLGMRRDLLARIRTAVTVHSRRPMPDLRFAPPLVRQTFGIMPESADGRLLMDGNDGTFRITVMARTDSGAWFGRDAVLFVRSRPWPEYRTLYWARAAASGADGSEPQKLPSC